MTNSVSPFCSPLISLPATGSGVLDGMRFAVKDVFDIAGHVTGCGNPDWLRSHTPAMHTASVVTAMSAAGATMCGKTLTDELAYSLNGENHHYGTPANPRAPQRIPGGSSSGSASAVAHDQVEVALGTDCGGSIRLPSSFCGLFGLRPTHGRVATDGLVPLARSFDTVGWFASSADHLRRVGQVLLGEDDSAIAPRRLVIATDLFDLLEMPERAALQASLDRLKVRFDEVIEVTIGDGMLDGLMQAFRTLQAAEIWHEHGDWITREKPVFGPGVQQRFDNTAHISADDVARAQTVRDALRDRLDGLLTPGTVMCLPSAPTIAPLRDTPIDTLETFRGKAMRMLCVAGLAGTPQLSIPVTLFADAPLGLSLMMRRGADRALLDFVATHEMRDPWVDLVAVNLPTVHAEVSTAFARYEQALIHNQVAMLDHLFLNSERTIRYGAAEQLYGADAIREYRAARPATGLMRTLHNTVITTFGHDTATACTEFSRAGSSRIGRQTQTWIRTAAGWKVAAAHVSVIEPP